MLMEIHRPYHKPRVYHRHTNFRSGSQVLVEDADPTVHYFAIEAVTNHGDATVFPALAYVRDHATDVDYEGRPVADTARWAIGKISRRTSPA
jgi:hypothetical protein